MSALNKIISSIIPNRKNKEKGRDNPYKALESQIRDNLSNKIFKIDDAIQKEKDLAKQLKLSHNISHHDIVKIMYKAKYVSLNTESLPNLTPPALFDSEMFDAFNLSTTVGDGIRIQGYFRHNKREIEEGKRLIKLHDDNPITITKKGLLDDLKNTILNMRNDISYAIIYYLSNRVIVSQSSSKNIKTLSITPVTMCDESYSSIGGTVLENAMNALKSDAIKKHCNGIIHVHIYRDDDEMSDDGKVIADLVRIKNHPLIHGNYPHVMTNITLLRKLQEEYNHKI